MRLQTIITYWFLGGKHPRVPPLRFIKAYNFPNKKTIGVKISQMRKTIKHVIRAAELANFDVLDGIGSVDKATRLYEAVKKYFIFLSTHQRRFTDLTWKTIFLILQKNKFKLVGEEEGIDF